jgi:hypothetical protein
LGSLRLARDGECGLLKTNLEAGQGVKICKLQRKP